jgi:hypothetical protein
LAFGQQPTGQFDASVSEEAEGILTTHGVDRMGESLLSLPLQPERWALLCDGRAYHAKDAE